MESLLVKDREGMKESEQLVTAFVNKNELDEENSDQLIDRIVKKPDGSRINIVIPANRYDEVSDKELSQRIGNDAQFYETQAMAKVEAIMNENESTVSQEGIKALEEEVMRILNEPSLGVEVAFSFLDLLKGDFERYSDMMRDEKQKLDMNVEQMRTRVRHGQAELDNAARSWNLFGKKNRIIQSRNSLVNGVQTLLNMIIDARRRSLAMTVYSNLLADIVELKAKIDKIKNQLDMGYQDFRAQYKKQLSTKERKSVLVSSIIDDEGIVALYDKYIEDLAQEKANFLTKYGPLSGFSDIPVEEIIKKITDYTKERFKIVLEQSVDDFISASKDSVDIPGLVDDLIFKAVPYWNYNSALLQHGGNVKQIVVLGVEDGEQSTVMGEFKSRPFGAEEDNVSSTGDKDRVTILNTTHGLPLFAISSMQNYKYSYDQIKESGSKPLHISSEYLDLPGLEPGGDTGIINFALAAAFNYVIQSGANYIYKLEDELADTINLGKGRENAAKGYGARKDLARDTTSRIEKKMQAEGANGIIKELQAYYERECKSSYRAAFNRL